MVITSQNISLYKPLFEDETSKKISNFLTFKRGWSFGDGEPFSKVRIEESLKFHSTLIQTGWLQTDAFPGVNGEIRVTAYAHDTYLEFTLEADGTWTFYHEVNNLLNERVKNLSFEQVCEKIPTSPIWSSSEYYRLNDIGTGEVNDLTAWRSGHRNEIMGFPSCRESASPGLARIFASTLESSTQQSVMSLRSSGGSTVRFCRVQ